MRPGDSLKERMAAVSFSSTKGAMARVHTGGAPGRQEHQRWSDRPPIKDQTVRLYSAGVGKVTVKLLWRQEPCRRSAKALEMAKSAPAMAPGPPWSKLV